MDTEKRTRGRNYTELEKQMLLDIIRKSNYYNIVEDKKTDNVAVQKKNKTWERVADKYNSVAETGPRSGTQLKLLYIAIKKKVKKDIQDDKVEMYKLEGGTFKRKLDDTGEKYLELVRSRTVETRQPIDEDSIDTSPPLDVMVDHESDKEIKYSVIEKNSCSSSAMDQSLPFASVASPSSVSPSPASSSLLRRLEKKTTENSQYRLDANKIKLEILELRKRREEAELKLVMLKLNFKKRKMELKK